MLNQQQFKEFRLAQSQGIDPRILENMTAAQMRETRLAAESKLNLSYFTADVSAEKMNAIRNLLRIKADIDPAFVHSFNAEQLKQIKLGLDYGLDIEKYRYPYLTARQMRKIRRELFRNKLLSYIRDNGLMSIFSVLSFRSYDDPKLIQYTDKIIEHIENKGEPEKQDHDIGSYVQNQFIPAMEEVHMADITLTDDVDQPDASDKSSVKKDHTLLAHNTAFLNCALVSVSENDFRVIKDYDEHKGIDDYPDINIVKYDNAVEAAKDYQSIVIELEKDDVQFKLATQNLNVKEKVILDLHNEISKTGVAEPEVQAFMVDMINEHGSDIRPVLLKKVAESSDSIAVQSAAENALEQNKADKDLHESEKQGHDIDRLIEKAKDVNTSSTKLNNLAEKNNDPRILVAVLQNPNCSTTLIKKYLEHENKDIQQAAKTVMERRSQMKRVQAHISPQQILKEIPSHLLDKEGKPIMISIVRLPDSNKFGVGATCIIPSSAIKIDGNTAFVNLNSERTFEIRAEGTSKGHITGEELSQQLGASSRKSLDERLNDAHDKQQSRQLNEQALEKQEGLEQKQPSVER